MIGAIGMIGVIGVIGGEKDRNTIFKRKLLEEVKR